MPLGELIYENKGSQRLKSFNYRTYKDRASISASGKLKGIDDTEIWAYWNIKSRQQVQW
jgi:hypothetical protein